MSSEPAPPTARAGPIAGSPEVEVVMPAYQASEVLPLSLPAALAAAGEGRVLVVDPGSTDGTAELARELGALVLELGERAGPARARNEGVARTSAPVVLFLDADCVAHPDVVERVRAAFEDPELVSLTGSYDDHPPDPGFFSQYMNLRHHYTHQRASRERATFWAGCGAVRRSAFLEAGGFDAERYPRPMIEDIELGLRLARIGATRLDPALQVTHLKRWTLRDVVATDIRSRAIPWSRLILASGAMPNDLNLRASQRAAAMLAPLVLAGAAALPVAIALRAWGWTVAIVAAFVAALCLNAGLAAFFASRRGPLFALGAFLFHQLHLAYSAATWGLCWLGARAGARAEAAR